MKNFVTMDAQDSLPLFRCDICGGEVYGDDLIHYIDGFTVCPECFDDFVFDYFIGCMMTGRELLYLLENH